MSSDTVLSGESLTSVPWKAEESRIGLIDAENAKEWQQRLKSQLAGLIVLPVRSVVTPTILQEADRIASRPMHRESSFAELMYGGTAERIGLVAVNITGKTGNFFQFVASLLPRDFSAGNAYILTASQRAVTKQFLAVEPSNEEGYVVYFVLPMQQDSTIKSDGVETNSMLFEVLESPDLAFHREKLYVPFAARLDYRKVKVSASACLVVRKNMVVRYCGSTVNCAAALAVCFDKTTSSSSLKLTFIRSAACLQDVPQVRDRINLEVAAAQKDGRASSKLRPTKTFNSKSQRFSIKLDPHRMDDKDLGETDGKLAADDTQNSRRSPEHNTESEDANIGEPKSTDYEEIGPDDCHVRPCALRAENGRENAKASDPCMGTLANGARCGKKVHPYCNRIILGHVVNDPDEDKLYCSDCYGSLESQLVKNHNCDSGASKGPEKHQLRRSTRHKKRLRR